MSQQQQNSQAMVPAGNGATSLFSRSYTTIYDLLAKNKAALAEAATKHLSVDRLTKLALTEIRKTPDLALCDPPTVVASVMQAAQLGLEIGGPLGRSYLVPFNNSKTGRKECQLIIGYKGMIELALRSGMVETIEGYPVYEGDVFEYSLGLNRKLEHEPCGEDDPAKLTHAYAIVRFKGGGVLFTVLTRNAIEKVRDRSAGGRNAIWKLYFPEMGVKTAIRRIFKFTPASPEIARAVAIDELAEAGVSTLDALDADIVAPAAPEEKVPPKEPAGALDKLVDRARKPAGQVSAISEGQVTTEKTAAGPAPVEGTPETVAGEVVDSDDRLIEERPDGSRLRFQGGVYRASRPIEGSNRRSISEFDTEGEARDWLWPIAASSEPTTPKTPATAKGEEETLDQAMDRWHGLLSKARSTWDKAPAERVKREASKRIPMEDPRFEQVMAAYRDVMEHFKQPRPAPAKTAPPATKTPAPPSAAAPKPAPTLFEREPGSDDE